MSPDLALVFPICSLGITSRKKEEECLPADKEIWHRAQDSL